MLERPFSKIISGGQTGVDRAALDVAFEAGIPCGGWCPKGRKAEDGPIDPKYPLKETKSEEYPVRTEANVIEADGTFVLTFGRPTEGTAFTIQAAVKHKKPYLLIDLKKKINPLFALDWAKKRKIRILNVAGPKESKIPGIYKMAKDFLMEILLAEKE
jgi:predicted Rossmann-fold nucleotide-binding protein